MFAGLLRGFAGPDAGPDVLPHHSAHDYLGSNDKPRDFNDGFNDSQDEDHPDPGGSADQDPLRNLIRRNRQDHGRWSATGRGSGPGVSAQDQRPDQLPGHEHPAQTGALSWRFIAYGSGTVTAIYAGSATTTAATSAASTLRVQSMLTISVPGRGRLNLTVQPLLGQTVALQRLRGSTWTTVARRNLPNAGANMRAEVTTTGLTAGAYRFRVTVGSGLLAETLTGRVNWPRPAPTDDRSVRRAAATRGLSAPLEGLEPLTSVRQRHFVSVSALPRSYPAAQPTPLPVRLRLSCNRNLSVPSQHLMFW